MSRSSLIPSNGSIVESLPIISLEHLLDAISKCPRQHLVTEKVCPTAKGNPNKISKNLKSNGLIIVIEPNKEFISDRLNIKSDKFDSSHYNHKQLKLQKSRQACYHFSKDKTIIYNQLIDKWFIFIIKKK